MNTIAPISKATWAAVAAAVTSGLTALLTALPDGVTAAEWIGVVLAAVGGSVVTGGVTYAAPKNQPKRGARVD